jgi:kumamolisin
LKYSIHLKPVSDSGLGFHLDIVKYLRAKKLTAALFHEHRVIRFETSNPGVITHLKRLFGNHILCILSDSHGKGLYKRPKCHVTPFQDLSDYRKQHGLFGQSPVPLTPGSVAQAYNFPKPTADIKNRVVAILELGGGFDAANVLNYCKSQNVTYPRMWQHNFSTGANVSDGVDGADGEVSLDIDVVAAVAPGVQILVIFAPNTTNGFINAISNIATYFKKPDCISISWGQAEDQWDTGAQEAMNNAIKSCTDAGINVFVAAGDNGSSDGETGNHVDFPASSPYSIACGGTKLILNPDGSRKSETVWNEWLSNEGATGGGVSVSGRKVPDIAGNADPQSGYIVNVDGQQSVIGGTSAVAPLMAGLNALLNSNLDQPVSNLRDVFYGNPSVFFDVTSGNNGAYSASVGYDCCTGLGVPDGSRLLAVLQPKLQNRIVNFCKRFIK